MFRNLTRQKPAGLADLLLPFSMVEDSVLLQTDGSLLAGWKYAGPDTETATYPQMAALADRLNEVLRLGSGWMIQANGFRREASGYPPAGAFPDPVTRAIDDERREQNKQAGARFESEYFFTLTYLPPHRSEHAMQKFLYGSPEEGGAADKALQVFRTAVESFENVFASLFRAERLKSRTVEHPGGFRTQTDDLLAYYRRCLDGDNSALMVPPIPAHLNDFLACSDFTGGLEPCIGEKRIAVIAIDGFPTLGYPGILGELNALGLEYRWSTRAILLSEQEAVKAFQEIRRGYAAAQRGFGEKSGVTDSGQVDLHAIKRTAETDLMMADVKEGRVQACLYSSSVILLNRDPKELREQARIAHKAIQQAGFSARVEKTNAIEAWLGTLPGDGYSDVRRVYMSTENVSDLLPISAIWSGRRENPSQFLPPGTPPLLIAGTTGFTQFRFHLHVGDVGHMFLVGPTGSGKSTALSLIAAQWFRIPKARVIAFDYGQSMWPLTMAVGGEFYAPGAEVDAGFCPLAWLDELGEIPWAAEWIETLCELHDKSLTAIQKNRVAAGLRLVAANPPGERTLTHARAHIQDEGVRTALDHFTGAGPLAYLFDAENLSMNASDRFVCIETSHLMSLSEKALIPAILYMFHCVERSLDGSPTLLILDEAWVALSHPLFRKRLEQWLITMRKLNCAVVFATQQLSQIARSGIGDTVLANCPTKIFLPNADATSRGSDGQRGSLEFYEDAGLNEREILAIRSAIPKRDYFVTSPEGRRMVDFGLGPVALAFCGVSGEEERERMKQTIRENGFNWRGAWLRKKQLPTWADYLDQLAELFRRQQNNETEKEFICEPDNLLLRASAAVASSRN